HAFLYTSLFFLHDPAPADIYTLSLHDALPIFPRGRRFSLRLSHRAGTGRSTAHRHWRRRGVGRRIPGRSHASLPARVVRRRSRRDRKSTRLNSSHVKISYAVFCLKKKKTK